MGPYPPAVLCALLVLRTASVLCVPSGESSVPHIEGDMGWRKVGDRIIPPMTELERLAGALMRARRYSEAAERYQTLVEDDGSNGATSSHAAMHNLAVALSAAGRHAEAEPWQRRVLSGLDGFKSSMSRPSSS